MNIVEITTKDAPPEATGLFSVLQEDGKTRPGLEPDLTDAERRHLYETMVLNREFDQRMITLQRQGRIGFYLASTGEEAATIGSAFAMRPTDWIFPCYREGGAYLVRGVPLVQMVSNLFGKALDPTLGRQMPVHYSFRQYHMVSNSSPVGTQIPQAAGAAWAARLQGHDTAVLVYFGEGTTSGGEFHVGVNFGGVFKAPVVFLCRNNQWAISTPREKQTAAESFALKAVAYGIEGVRVDGTDLLAVIAATRKALVKARAGGGPTLIETVAYRLGAHSTSDDPTVYRPEAEVKAHEGQDPLVRFRKHLQQRGLWDEAYEAQVVERARTAIADAVKAVEQAPDPSPETLFSDVFAELTPELLEQREDLLHHQSQQPGHPGHGGNR